MKSPKIQRWIDILASLLARRLPVTFEGADLRRPRLRQRHALAGELSANRSSSLWWSWRQGSQP